MKHLRLLLRLLWRTLLVRRQHTGVALLAILVAATVSTAALNLFADLESKLTREFRSVGANVVILAVPGGSLDGVIETIRGQVGENDLVLPSAYAVAHTASGAPVVVVGIDLGTARRMNPWWKVEPEDGEAKALSGLKALTLLRGEDDSTFLTFNGRTLRLPDTAQLTTGGPEDSRIYLSMDEFRAWTNVPVTVLEVAIQGNPQAIEQRMAALRASLSNAEVRPVRQVQEAEVRILQRTRAMLLSSVLVISILAALSVLTSLGSSVLERSKDYALMKALGASRGTMQAIFLGEACILGATGAVLGYGLGALVSMWIGQVNFQAAVLPRLEVFPVVLLGSLAITFTAALVPLARLATIQPANMLKGE